MNFSKEELYQKHLDFEMSLVASERFSETINDELQFFYSQLENETLSSLIPKEKAIERTIYILEKLELNENLLRSLEQNIQSIIENFKDDSSSLSSMLDKQAFQDFINALLGMKEIRNKLVHFVVHSKAYSKMISNVIYSAIKDFLITQNPLAKNNPLGSSILKIGQDLLNSLPGMEGNFDKKITEFIEKNLSGRIQESENFIINELDSENTKEIVQEFWKFLEETRFSQVATKVSLENIKKVTATLPSFWKHLKEKKLLQKYIRDLIEKLYSYYSDKKVSEVLSELGFSKENVVQFSSEILNSSLNNDKFRQHYKQFISRRLRMFYDTL